MPCTPAPGVNLKLNLRQIEVFRAVMLSGSISGAARLLFVSQPAVSRLLAYTEQRLGLRLFERIKGRLHPTPEARRLFDEVQTVYEGVQRVNDLADNLAQGRSGQLRIASSPNLGQSLIPQATALFCQRHPGVRVVLRTLIPPIMLQSLLTSQVELGVTHMPVVHPALASVPLCRNPVVAMLPPGHRLAGKAAIQAADLAQERFIGYSDDIPFSQLVTRMFGDAAMPAHVEVQQTHVACAMVRAGIGVTLVDEMSSRGPMAEGLCAVPVEPATCAPIGIFHLYSEPLSRLAQEYIDILRSLQP